MDYYIEIKEKLINDQIYSREKDYSKERHRVITYFEIGKLLEQAGNVYGKKIIESYSKKLEADVGKKFNKRTLFRIKQFYNIFSSKKVSTMWTQLTWSHLRLLLNLNLNAINFYIISAIKGSFSVRELEQRIKCRDFERTNNYNKVEDKALNIQQLIKNPIIIKQDNKNIYSERALKEIILNNLEMFLSELGNCYAFIKSEYKIKMGDIYNYIDLLLFNYEYNCFVVVELKVTPLKKDHIGQIQVYMNYIDEKFEDKNYNKTIGIIICKENNEYIIRYSSDERIIAREYIII